MDVKPGWATTEFWVTLLTGVLAVVAIFSHSIEADKFGAIVQAAALIMAAISSAAYSHARAKVKSAPEPGVAIAAGSDPSVNVGDPDGPKMTNPMYKSG